MARSGYDTLLSLDQYAQVMGINPWEFNQVGRGLPANSTRQCQAVWYQYAWQKDTVCRDEIAEAIADAEDMIASRINFYPAPKYFTDEEHTNPRPRNNEVPGWVSKSSHWKRLATDYWFIQNVGVLTFTQLDTPSVSGSEVVSTDLDGDGFDDTYVITVTLASEPAIRELALFPGDDWRLEEAIDDSWRIRPFRVTKSGTTYIFYVPKYACIQYELQERYNPSVLDASDAIFVTDFIVARRWTDTAHTVANPNQGIAIWDVPDTCDPDCDVQTYPVCYANYERESGLVNVQLEPDSPYYWYPDKLRINYVAGIPEKDFKMEHRWALTVARLATALLSNDKCGCERSNIILANWRNIPSLQKERARPLSIEEINSEFGPAEGALYAWKQVSRYVVDSERID